MEGRAAERIVEILAKEQKSDSRMKNRTGY
jgi:hypothetical protein